MSTNLHPGESTYFKTYNNVVDLLMCIGQSHNLINKTTNGDIYDIDLEKNTLFPLMHINPVNVQANQSSLVFNFQIFIADLVEPNFSNEQDVMSDTLNITLDIIAFLKHRTPTNQKFHIQKNASFNCEPFTERFDNSLFGWVLDLSIMVEHDYSDCLNNFSFRDSNIPDSTENCMQ